MNHFPPVPPLKTFLPFHPMLPGMFFLVPTSQASLLPQSASPAGSAVSSTLDLPVAGRTSPPTRPSGAKPATAKPEPGEPGR